MNYTFYFDETYHDRSITIKENGQLNTLTDGKNDSYIGVFWGTDSDHLPSILERFSVVEETYKSRLGLTQEFKSTCFAKKNFKYGIRSFNSTTQGFYSDLFHLLYEHSPIIHVNALSKIELLLRNIFSNCNLHRILFIEPNSFYYSMTKFLITYHSESLLRALFRATQNKNVNLFLTELEEHLCIVISSLRGIKRKEREVPALEQLLHIVTILMVSCNARSMISDKIGFVYSQNFDGLCQLLKEKGIPSCNTTVVIDTEEQTYRASNPYPFQLVVQADSSTNIGLRLADHLCGFIGRLMYALMHDANFMEDKVNDITQLSSNDIQRKHLLYSDWFDLKQAHFDLYHIVAKVLTQQQQAYWSTMTWSYCDQICMFYALLDYIASYPDYTEFLKHTPDEHAEYYNAACIDHISRHYANWNRLRGK